MHRFFVPPTALVHQPVTLTGAQAHQMRRVLRMRLGDRAVLLDGRGQACEAIVVAVGEDEIKLHKVRLWEARGEPRTHIALFQAVLKGDHFAWVLQKGTEVGISRFVPLLCEHNVVDDVEAIEGKRERWERIIREAAEQSGRGRLPELAPALSFAQAVQAEPGSADSRLSRPLRLILWEAEPERSLRQALAACNLASTPRIHLYVGPEGGLTSEEVQLAQRFGLKPITLGPRILRAETAGVVAAAIILYEAREMEQPSAHGAHEEQEPCWMD